MNFEKCSQKNFAESVFHRMHNALKEISCKIGFTNIRQKKKKNKKGLRCYDNQ